MLEQNLFWVDIGDDTLNDLRHIILDQCLAMISEEQNLCSSLEQDMKLEKVQINIVNKRYFSFEFENK